MHSAGFKIRCQLLGLTALDVAARAEVSVRTARRWWSNTLPPPEITHWITQKWEQAHQMIDRIEQCLADPELCHGNDHSPVIRVSKEGALIDHPITDGLSRSEEIALLGLAMFRAQGPAFGVSYHSDSDEHSRQF